ncbi:hypothetical protein J2W49_002938 [Hydrogenophaga palleronii]|uniref:Mercuric ion transport protein n=1 Tax=Hydrogenophaga palleronii TaxID=65655 RepID=A0ABU1WNT5_9BURK|nr:hypothetical protein [Hydrogenophaga palleronii]MDR7150965.1 hypothetical protein [Hydrogenophaga palleronii]
MKKPALTALGVAGACVACCTIPLAVPLFGGAAALGLTSWLSVASRIGVEMLILMVIASLAALVWSATVWARRRRVKACGTETSCGSACAVAPDAGGASCAPR